jgi:hypothetical protein
VSQNERPLLSRQLDGDLREKITNLLARFCAKAE